MADKRRWLIYATEQGGLFRFARPENFEDAKATGKLDISWMDGSPAEFVEPKYIALVESVDDFDFVLGRSR